MMDKEDGDKGPKSDNETATIGWMDLADNDIVVQRSWCTTCRPYKMNLIQLDEQEIIYFKGKLYRCPMCEHAFRSRNSTKDHFNKEHRGFRFQCPCGKEYKVKSSLTKHQEKCKQAA